MFVFVMLVNMVKYQESSNNFTFLKKTITAERKKTITTSLFFWFTNNKKPKKTHKKSKSDNRGIEAKNKLYLIFIIIVFI